MVYMLVKIDKYLVHISTTATIPIFLIHNNKLIQNIYFKIIMIITA